MGVGQLIKDFSGWTSAHGLPQIGAAGNICIRLVWIGIVLGSLGLFCHQLSIIVEKYLQYGVTVSTEIKADERDFPAVTICSLNAYRYDKLRSLVSGTAHKDLELMIELIDNYKNAVAAPTTPLTPADTFGFNSVNTSIRVQSRAKENLVYVAGSFNETRLSQLTYKRHEFILECHYAKEPCNMTEDFKEIRDPIYGACFQFNNEVPVRYVNSRSGPGHGLRILLKNPQKYYLPMTEGAGARIAVHTQNQEPFPDAFGYNAAIGFSTSVAMKFTRTVRLSSPYGDCTDEKGDYPYLYKDTAYTMEGCYRSCFQQQIMKDCNCADPRFAIPENKSVCTIYHKYNCTDKYSVSQKEESKEAFNLIKDCHCPQRCQENIFGVTMSSSRWPSDTNLIKECLDPNNEWYSSNPVECNDKYHKNTMVVEIYFDRMDFKLLEESAGYDMLSVILNFAGQLGLWQGASVITVVEFLALGMMICMVQCSKRRGGEVSDENIFDGPQADAEDELTEEEVAMAEELERSKELGSGPYDETVDLGPPPLPR